MELANPEMDVNRGVYPSASNQGVDNIEYLHSVAIHPEKSKVESFEEVESLQSMTKALSEEEDELAAQAGDSGSDASFSQDGNSMDESTRDVALSAVRNGDSDIEGGHSGSIKESKSPPGLAPSCSAPMGTPTQHTRGQVARSPPSSTSRSKRKLESLHPSLQFVSMLAHLTTFGILGVLIRYGSEVLFGPELWHVTADNSSLFIDLPANMLGSYFMGWVGVVFKKDILLFSENLSVGLATGLMGSITTYAAMIQRMLAVMVSGLWVDGFCGLLIGMLLAQASLLVGMDSARLFLRLIAYLQHRRERMGLKIWTRPQPDNLRRRRCSLILFLLFGGLLWGVAVFLTVLDEDTLKRRSLWLACVVAPPGVWTRWYLARLNGQGIGPKQYVRWLPVGTIIVNLVAAALEAGLSTTHTFINTYNSTLLVSALQLGLLGCMSTVSTFVVEIHAMHQGKQRWRAYFYPLSTILTSVIIGVLVYGIPVWEKNLHSKYIHIGEDD